MNGIGVSRRNESIDDKVEIGLTEFHKATNETQQQPKNVSTQFHWDFLLSNQQLNALKRHHRIAQKLAEMCFGDIGARAHINKVFTKTIRRRPEQLSQQDFTPEAENEERQQEITPTEIGERQQDFTAAAEIGEPQQFTPVAETEKRQQEFSPAAENEESQQDITPAAEIGEPQQFTPEAETEKRQQEFTPTVELGEAQQGGEHSQMDGFPHGYGETLFDEISQVPSNGFVKDTSLTFIDLPDAVTETAQKSDSTDESDDEIEFRITESRNIKPKRPNVEICLLCMEEVKKMRDHLTNRHTIGTENKLRNFISTYHSTN